jgi:WD repeat-containing protein 61
VACSSSLDSQIRIWNIGEGSLKKVIDAGSVEAWSASFSPDNRFIATGTHAGNINMFDVQSGEKDRVLQTGGKFIMSVAFVISCL